MSRFRHDRPSWFRTVFVLVVGGFVGWQSALYAVEKQQITPGDTAEATEEVVVEVDPVNLDLFWEVYGYLDEEFVDAAELDSEEQLYGAIKGMVESFDDPYTVFMTPDETTEFQTSLDGTLHGIGAELTMENGNLVVIAPLKGSPAEEAGLLPGDIIYMIDDKFTADLTLFDAIMSIRGEEGTTVKLTIVRDGLQDAVILEIERAEIDIPSVELEYKGEEGDIAYINIYQFVDDTEIEFDKVVQELLLKDINGVILDLRYNGGGYLDVSIDILSDFLEGKQKAVITKHREEEDNEIFYTNESARLADIPLVVLVNVGSASASEIVAGAIQDYERGIVMGELTYGKGSVQTVESMDDGSSLRYTIAKWYTPNDRSIDDVGITPDIEVKISEEDFAADIDTQLNEAVKYLEGL